MPTTLLPDTQNSPTHTGLYDYAHSKKLPKICCSELYLLTAIHCHGRVRSLRKLATALNLDYRSSRRYACRLERRGMINIERRGPGTPLILTPVPLSHIYGEIYDC